MEREAVNSHVQIVKNVKKLTEEHKQVNYKLIFSPQDTKGYQVPESTCTLLFIQET